MITIISIAYFANNVCEILLNRRIQFNRFVQKYFYELF